MHKLVLGQYFARLYIHENENEFERRHFSTTFCGVISKSDTFVCLTIIRSRQNLVCGFISMGYRTSSNDVNYRPNYGICLRQNVLNRPLWTLLYAYILSDLDDTWCVALILAIQNEFERRQFSTKCGLVMGPLWVKLVKSGFVDSFVSLNIIRSRLNLVCGLISMKSRTSSRAVNIQNCQTSCFKNHGDYFDEEYIAVILNNTSNTF